MRPSTKTYAPGSATSCHKPARVNSWHGKPRPTAPIAATDGWRDYTDDQIALLDHLGVDRFHVAGMCIAGSFIMGLVEGRPRTDRFGRHDAADRV